MRLIDVKDVEKINAKITPQKWENLAKDSYYKTVTDDACDLMEINYESMPELEGEVVKINGDIDEMLLRSMIITSVKARSKYERELDDGLYEYAEEHKNDIPAFIYVF